MIWCLHGAVGMAEDWKKLSTGLGQGGETVRRVDLWRYLDCCPMELGEFGKAFCEEVRAAGGAESGNVLVGYSMGGRLALHALLEGAEEGLFAGAVIVGAHPGLLTEEERIVRMGRDAEWAGKALVGDWRAFLREWEGQAVLTQVAPEGWGDRRKLSVRHQAVARSFMDWSLGKQKDLRERLGALDLPVLWVTGERDRKFTALAEEVVPLLNRGRHEVVAGAGHRVPWEEGDAFQALVEGFLADL
ncbi:MAG: alpha/beta fold hydrolase [Verrucomicrobia bacterium]|nr:alpha/beta fold hydrolase [Verrucomicrobiota bacterium]